jgi:hypothetical protein
MYLQCSVTLALQTKFVVISFLLCPLNICNCMGSPHLNYSLYCNNAESHSNQVVFWQVQTIFLQPPQPWLIAWPGKNYHLYFHRFLQGVVLAMAYRHVCASQL